MMDFSKAVPLLHNVNLQQLDQLKIFLLKARDGTDESTVGYQGSSYTHLEQLKYLLSNNIICAFLESKHHEEL